MFSKKFLIVSFLGIGMIFPASFYLGSNSAWAAALIVPDNFPGIQQAIDAAQSGDTILINPGVNIGGINFGGKDLLIQSTKGPELTTIDGNRGTGGKIEVLKMFDL